jgi:predicted transcriptional regulator
VNTTELTDLLNVTRTLADESRLRLISLTADGEHTVTDLAAALGLSESTVSHHLKKLRAVNLLTLRMDGTYRYYRLNKPRLKTFRALAARLEEPVTEPEDAASDDSWIDALDMAEKDKRVLRAYTHDGKLKQIPKKDKKWIVILSWLVTQFEPDRRYTEQQVNEVITRYHPDYATIRRDLIGFGFMRREIGGGDYWRTPENEPTPQK